MTGVPSETRLEAPTSQTRVVELNIPQTRFVQDVQFCLVCFGNILEVLGIVWVGLLCVCAALLISHMKPLGHTRAQSVTVASKDDRRQHGEIW